MQEGIGTEDQESVWKSRRRTAELQVCMSFKADIFQSETYTIGDAQSDNCCYIGGDAPNRSF